MSASKNNISEIYLSRIKKHVYGKKMEQAYVNACFSIIISILKKDINQDSYFNFSSLFKMSGLTISQKKIFAETVYILAHPNIDFIYQKFQYFGEDSFWHDIDLDIIYVSNRDNEYYHPTKHIQISKEEFNDIVLPYFVPSNELLKFNREKS
jgi:hypothetical protein